MPQPTETLYFSKGRGKLLLRGLQVLVNGVVTCASNEHLSKDLFFPGLINLFQPRQYDAALATQTRVLRNRVRSSLNSGGRRLRLKYHDVVVLQLALRVARRKSPTKDTMLGLENCLETIRKRLKRAVCHRLGYELYKAQQHRWTLYQHWLRLNVLMERRPRRVSVRVWIKSHDLGNSRKESTRRVLRLSRPFTSWHLWQQCLRAPRRYRR